MVKQVLVLAVFFLSCLLLHAQRTENVVILVIDGARYTETFGDESHKYIPRIWNDLKPQGTIYTSFYNNGATTTCSGHSSLMTGNWHNIANNGTERPHYPTILEYYRKHTNDSVGSSYVVLGKKKLNILSHSDYANDSLYRASVLYSDQEYSDSVAFANLRKAISEYKPKLIVANFPEVDKKGHIGIYEDYLQAIRQADSLVNETWKLIQSDSFYANKTMLIVTNDHGRHTNDFTTHGDNCDGCRHLMLLAVGPEVPIGIVDDNFCELIDIVPSIGQVLQISTSLATGKVLKSLTGFAEVVNDTVYHQNFDTLIVNTIDTINVYDTVVVDVVDSIKVFDTVITSVIDTVYIEVHDTITVSLYDSVLITIHDTIKHAVTDTLYIDVDIKSSVEKHSNKDVLVFTNSANNRLIIRVDEAIYESLSGCSVEIVDANGIKIYSSSMNEMQLDLDIEQWSNIGLYFIRIIDYNQNLLSTKSIILY